MGLTFLISKLEQVHTLIRIKILVFLSRNRISFGNNNVVYPDTKFRVVHGGKIIVGNSNEFLYGVLILTYGGQIRIGDRCSINPYTIIYGHGKGVSIGNDVLIAGQTMIIPANHNYADISVPISCQGELSKGIVIEDNVWIGAGCKILDGVRISKGAIVAAGSVVNRDVPPNAVYGGVPARLLKYRNEII